MRIIGIYVCKHTRAGANSHMVGCDGAPTADPPKAVKPRKKLKKNASLAQVTMRNH